MGIRRMTPNSTAPTVDRAPPPDQGEAAEDVLRQAAEDLMPQNEELLRLPPSPPPAEWWDEDSLF